MKNNNIIFRNEEHKNFFYQSIKRCQYHDCFHVTLLYCLGIDDNTRHHIESIYDFDKGTINVKVLQEPWQTSSSRQTIRLAFNLFSSSTPSVDRSSTIEEQLSECRKYSAVDIFSSTYRKYFWQAVNMMYTDCFEWQEFVMDPSITITPGERTCLDPLSDTQED